MDNPDSSTKSRDLVALPQGGISEIMGLVELLKSKGGSEEIYKLAQELQMEFGDTLAVIRGAEVLGLVKTPGGDVVLESLGERLTRTKISERKEVIKEQLEKIPLFKQLGEFLKQKENQEATKDQILEQLVELVPNENVEQTFSSLVNWGRYAELFGYNDDRETFYLDTGS